MEVVRKEIDDLLEQVKGNVLASLTKYAMAHSNKCIYFKGEPSYILGVISVTPMTLYVDAKGLLKFEYVEESTGFVLNEQCNGYSVGELEDIVYMLKGEKLL